MGSSHGCCSWRSLLGLSDRAKLDTLAYLVAKAHLDSMYVPCGCPLHANGPVQWVCHDGTWKWGALQEGEMWEGVAAFLQFPCCFHAPRMTHPWWHHHCCAPATAAQQIPFSPFSSELQKHTVFAVFQQCCWHGFVVQSTVPPLCHSRVHVSPVCPTGELLARQLGCPVPCR